MKTKRLLGIIVSLMLAAFFIWSSFKPNSALATIFDRDLQNSTSHISGNSIAQASTSEFTLPPLPYAYDALDP